MYSKLSILIILCSTLLLTSACSSKDTGQKPAQQSTPAAVNTPAPKATATKPLSAEEKAVKKAYKTVLERDVDQKGLQDWATALRTKKNTLKQIYIGLGTSAEYHKKFIAGKTPAVQAKNIYRHFSPAKSNPQALQALAAQLKKNPASWSAQVKNMINTNTAL